MRTLQQCLRWSWSFLVACVFLTSTVPSGASSSGELSDEEKSRIDAIFAEWDRIDFPGVAVGVIRDGALVYSKGYGSADLEHDVPIDSKTVFYMASVSKHFVTFCILLLEEQGKLSLDDEVQKYLPDFPRYDDPLTIRHFIHHTSGVRDNLTLWKLVGNDVLDHIEDEAIYELIKRQKTLNFKPGERHLYSNACYFMLARIVDGVSGLTIKDFAQKHMFGPLGMENTHFHDDVNHIIKNRAFSYEPSGDGFRNLVMRYDLVGSGGLYSNIEDMGLWDRNFSDNKLGKGGSSIIDKMHEEGLLDGGESCGYAFGLVNGTLRGLRTVSHGGALAGYRTYYLRFPDQGCSIVLLANLSSCSSGGLARAVAGVVLENVLAPEATSEPANVGGVAPEFIELPPELLERFTGVFRVGGGREVTVTLEDASLKMKQSWNGVEYPIAATGSDTFIIAANPSVKFTFSKIESDKAQILTVDQSGRETVGHRKMTSAQIDLAEFAGSYFSEELNVYYQLFIDGGVLKSRIRYRHGNPWSLDGMGRDRFEGGNVTFRFNRKDGKIVGFELDAGRVTNLRFTREPSARQ